MRRIAFLCRLVGLGSLAVGIVVMAPALAPAADESADIQQRIAAVENGLTPRARIKGKPPRKIEERMRELRVPGASIAVIHNYKVEWAKGYGVADAETATPVTTDMLFQAASMSKPVTSLAALDLVEEGQLDLDRDVNAQLKSWKVPENEFTRQHAVDLRGIMSHTAGLTIHGFPGYATTDPLPTVPQILDGEKPANTQAVRVDKTPGQGFRYSGGGTTVMQQLMIDVTGKPFPTIMRERVLDPLAMSASTFDQPLDEKRRSSAASAHDRAGKPIAGRWHVYPEMAPAGLWTNPSEMCKYVIEIQLAHEGKSAKIVERKTIEEMLKPQGGGPVGLGPFLQQSGGVRRFEHSGGNRGFACNFVGLLDRGEGAVVMTNSDFGGQQLVAEIVNGIAVVYGWPDYLPSERDE